MCNASEISAPLVERYVALWNEADADRRRAEIVALWTPDGLHYAKTHTCHGYATLEERVTRSYERSIAPGVNVFRQSAPADVHHNVIRLRWQMQRRASGEVAANGMDILVLAEDGRIAADYQFIEAE